MSMKNAARVQMEAHIANVYIFKSYKSPNHLKQNVLSSYLHKCAFLLTWKVRLLNPFPFQSLVLEPCDMRQPALFSLLTLHPQFHLVFTPVAPSQHESSSHSSPESKLPPLSHLPGTGVLQW